MTGIRFLGCPGLAFHFGKFPHGVDDVAGDVGVSKFRRPSARKSNVVSCLTAVQSVDRVNTAIRRNSKQVSVEVQVRSSSRSRL